jgi:methyl-accepting chemotaxis protein
MFGIHRLNVAINLFQDDVLHHVAGHKTGAEISSAYAAAIQEWKNVLLRGKEPKDLEKHWAAHQRDMAKVDELLKLLDQQVDDASPEQALVSKLRTEMAAAKDCYLKAFAAYKEADLDFAAGDKAARGKDRAAAETLATLREALSRQEAPATKEAIAGASLATQLAVGVMLLIATVSLAGAIWMSRQITGPLNGAVEIADRVAHGDLSNTIETTRRDEVGNLLDSLKFMQANLSRLVKDVRHSSEGVATASAEIASGNSHLSARTESQASALEQTAASMEELGATVRQNADNARQANQLAHRASDVAVKGGEAVNQVVENMKGINDASRQIADIIGVIDGIAFQTNILALNAAVEAARAGEQGRGFAVVASEVRSLSQRSAQAAKEIKSLIVSSVERVERGTALVDQAGATMIDVVSAIRQLTDIVGEISSASTEQSSGVTQVGEAVTQMDQATQQNAALVEEIAAAAISMKGQATDLVQLVSSFKVAAHA